MHSSNLMVMMMVLSLAPTSCVSEDEGSAEEQGSPVDAGQELVDAYSGLVDATTVDAGEADANDTTTLSVSWELGALGINCIGNSIPADPWVASFRLEYDNSTGSATVDATIVSTQLVLSDPSMTSLNITVSPSSFSVAAGETITPLHDKTGSSTDIPKDCELCGLTAQLEIRLLTGGVTQEVVSPSLPVNCAF